MKGGERGRKGVKRGERGVKGGEMGRNGVKRGGCAPAVGPRPPMGLWAAQGWWLKVAVSRRAGDVGPGLQAELTPIFSSDLARTSQPFFWLTKMMMGGSKPCSRMANSFFLQGRRATMLHFAPRPPRSAPRPTPPSPPQPPSPLLRLRHEENLLLHPLVRFASRADVNHGRPAQVAASQALHGRRHGGCEHHRLQEGAVSSAAQAGAPNPPEPPIRPPPPVCICASPTQSWPTSSRGPRPRRCRVFGW